MRAQPAALPGVGWGGVWGRGPAPGWLPPAVRLPHLIVLALCPSCSLSGSDAGADAPSPLLWVDGRRSAVIALLLPIDPISKSSLPFPCLPILRLRTTTVRLPILCLPILCFRSHVCRLCAYRSYACQSYVCRPYGYGPPTRPPTNCLKGGFEAFEWGTAGGGCTPHTMLVCLRSRLDLPRRC